jgi:hypothetical protein
MAELPTINVKWMDDAGREVEKDEATFALVTTYDEDGGIVDETFGSVKPEAEVADQP